ncbi:MAG: transglycosylase SLT domain-containing protein, partial [Alphaproteobacteria bacterium]
MIDPANIAASANSLVNQVDIAGLPHKIAQAIKTAAAQTGVDFSYLLKKAAQESGFDPNAKASTSSATGLFQFTNQTWLRTLKEHGGEYGLSAYADHIKIDKSGVARVTDPNWKQAILALRKDPQISATMAGELDKDNLDTLKNNVGGKIGSTELYLAHFLGAGGASDFLKTMRANPAAKAAHVLPEAAQANPSVFYANGEARSVSQIYKHFAQKFEGKAGDTMVASAAQAAAKSYPKNTYATVADASDYLALPVKGNYTTSVMN